MKQAQHTLDRLWPRLAAQIDSEQDVFQERLQTHFPQLFELLFGLYGHQYDFFYHLEQILLTAATMYNGRPKDLRKLDNTRPSDWYEQERMVGGMCYVDLFAGDLQGVKKKIPYFEELGLTYLHLMPLFKAPEGNSDGGFAVSDYRSVNPKLGTIDDLRSLASALRKKGISLVLDFVFNHTSDEHEWATKALNGDETYQNYYFMFDDRTIPDQYELNLREIFPEQAPGNFTYREEIQKWVWTTFNRFQWDLNYRNPEVFNAMLGEMLYIANIGAEFLRLDAVAFVWKEMGTVCEGLPQAHTIIQAYRLLGQIVAPSMIFKSEAIVHPAEVLSYISMDEAPVAYNPTLMALLWNSLATRKVNLLRVSMQNWFELDEGCSWINYVRCHDDIGWTFADEDAAALGINGFDHRHFLNQFYTGRFEGSFAKGVPFNYNPVTHDMRISGQCASLAGLEQAIQSKDSTLIEHALRRIEMIHAIILSAGGIPLIYLGDELGLPNDYGYKADANKKDDSRHVHRIEFDWQAARNRRKPTTIEGRIFTTLQHLIKIRKENPVFANGETEFYDSGNQHVFCFTRHNELMVLANFSEWPQTVHIDWLPERVTDLVHERTVYLRDKRLTLDSYQFMWLVG